MAEFPIVDLDEVRGSVLCGLHVGGTFERPGNAHT